MTHGCQESQQSKTLIWVRAANSVAFPLSAANQA